MQIAQRARKRLASRSSLERKSVVGRVVDWTLTTAYLLASRERTRLRLQRLEQEVAELRQRFASRPYMAEDVFGAFGDLDEPMGYSSTASGGEQAGGLPGFADLFRGSEAFIGERQRVYLPLFTGRERVVDLGCGRGEFLRLMGEVGTPAVGVELDRSLVARLQAEGLEVVEADALAYLREQQAPGGLDAIFSAQVIEHLTREELVDLLALARSRLRTGGLFVAETVNPESFEALKTFSVDLTHQRPIFPQVLLHLCREAGFSSARIFYPHGGGFTQRAYTMAGEYAVVAIA